MDPMPIGCSDSANVRQCSRSISPRRDECGAKSSGKKATQCGTSAAPQIAQGKDCSKGMHNKNGGKECSSQVGKNGGGCGHQGGAATAANIKATPASKASEASANTMTVVAKAAATKVERAKAGRYVR